MQKSILLFNTVKFLKPIQVYYRLYYFGRRKVRNLLGVQYPLSMTSQSVALTLRPSIVSAPLVNNKSFTFLNLSHTFEEKIDWNFSEYGKLWTYNLTYFDYLQQEKMTQEEGLQLIHDFIDRSDSHKDALEPFPVSLRGINWVKFLTTHKLQEQRIDDSLYAQYKILMDNLEYHLLGNHLLENGFSLLFGAYYFQDEQLYAKAKEILTIELEEQVLEDGGHFELSPMYHQIMLFRVLDCLNLLQNNLWQDNDLSELLTKKAVLMLQWLNTMTFEDGSIPLFNDSTNGIAPTTEQLNVYAKSLDINYRPSTIDYRLTDSGYRNLKTPDYECIIDVGAIGPDYIPGHAHADTFNFVLYIRPQTINHQPSTKIPFIIDTGLSTYETNARRTEERSTKAHNTVEINSTSSSQVWGGFRVADRAYVTQLQERDEKVIATHTGYEKKFGMLHTRAWQFKDKQIIIKDSLNKTGKAVVRLHFHPEVTEAMIEKHIEIANGRSSIQTYDYAPEFNKLIAAKVLEIQFEKETEVIINL